MRIIVDTSDQVYPAAGLLELTAERYITLIDVTLERTRFSKSKTYEYLSIIAATILLMLVERVEQRKREPNIEQAEDTEHCLSSLLEQTLSSKKVQTFL